MYKVTGFIVISFLSILLVIISIASANEPISILKRKEALLNSLNKQQNEQISLKSESIPIKINIKKNNNAQNTSPKNSQNLIKIKKNNAPKAILPIKADKIDEANNKISAAPKQLTPKFASSTNTIVKIEQNLTRTTITFLWDKQVQSAVFVNQNKLWIIFDKFTNLQFIDNSQQLINNINQYNIKIFNMNQRKIDNNNTFVVSDIELPENVEGEIIKAYKQDNSWIIEISHKYEKLKNIKVNPIFNSGLYPYLEIKTGEKFYNSIDYVDPFTNQNLSVIPLANPNVATAYKREFIDLNILETVQGVAIEKVSDNIKIKPLSNKSFLITKELGLNISPELYLVQGDNISINIMRSSKDAILNPSYFQSKHDLFITLEDKLLKKIITAKPSFKSRARLELAMFYLAHGFYNEAKATLGLAKEDDKMLNKKYQITLLSAALEFFTRNYKQAFREIQNFDLEDVPPVHRDEFRFWQSLISYSNAENYEYVALSNTLKVFINLNNNFLQYYTQQMLSEIGFIIFEYKIQNKSLDDAYNILSIIRKFPYPDSISRNRLNYDIALYHEKAHNVKNSLHYFDKCIDGFNDNLHYNRCQYYRALLLQNADMISTEQLIEVLERVKLRWKGDKFEIRVSKMLYNLYIKNNRVIDALRVGQSILENYSVSLDAVAMSNQMSKAFINFFLDKNEKNRDPLQALEIFFEFQHLLPVGNIGDEIILRVAEYLNELDLLDRYILLLEHQVKNRLTGFKKERAINKLAAAYIQNLQPINAINIMSFTSPNFKLPEFMARERKYIVAKALQKLGKNKEAINLLKDDLSTEADEIKSEIFWKNRDWRSFNDFSEPYLYSIRNKDFILNDKEIEHILRQMISYLNLKEYELLESLYGDFIDRIPTTHKHFASISLIINIAKAQQIKANNNLALDAEKIYELTSEMIRALDNI